MRDHFGGQDGGPDEGQGALYTFLPNEPTVLADKILCIMRMVNYLCRLQRVFAGGFVLENEPTGGVFWGAFGRKMGSLRENEAKADASRKRYVSF